MSGEAVAQGMVYAGFSRRGWALFLDLVLFWALCFPVALVVSDGSLLAQFAYIWLAQASALTYSVVCHARWGRTLGKWYMGVAVVRPDGSAVGYRQALLRSSVTIAVIAGSLIATLLVLPGWGDPEWLAPAPADLEGALVGPLGSVTVLDSILNFLWYGWLLGGIAALLVDRKCRALHDFLAGTVVVERREGEGIRDPASRPTRVKRPLVLAGFFRVSFASFVDALVFLPFGIPIWLIVEAEPSNTRAELVVCMAIAVILYVTVCLGRWGQTLGMRYTGIRLMRADGALLSYRSILVRHLLLGALFVFVFFVFTDMDLGPTEILFFPYIFVLYMFELWAWSKKEGDEFRDDEIVVVRRLHEAP